MSGTVGRVILTKDKKSGVIHYKNLVTEKGHSGSPLLLMCKEDNHIYNKTPIQIKGASDRFVNEKLVGKCTGIKKQITQYQYEIIGIHIEGNDRENTACLITLDKLKWINSTVENKFYGTINAVAILANFSLTKVKDLSLLKLSRASHFTYTYKCGVCNEYIQVKEGEETHYYSTPCHHIIHAKCMSVHVQKEVNIVIEEKVQRIIESNGEEDEEDCEVSRACMVSRDGSSEAGGRGVKIRCPTSLTQSGGICGHNLNEEFDTKKYCYKRQENEEEDGD